MQTVNRQTSFQTHIRWIKFSYDLGNKVFEYDKIQVVLVSENLHLLQKGYTSLLTMQGVWLFALLIQLYKT